MSSMDQRRIEKQSCSLNRMPVVDYLHLTRRSDCFGTNDARVCFDRIVHIVAILVFMSFRVSATSVRTLFGTLQKAHHRIKTGFGIFDHVYGNKDVPIQGAGQGNGIAPTARALTSTNMFQVMDRAGHGRLAVTAISGTILSLVGFAFVDDADLVDGTIDVGTPGEDLIDRFQVAMDRWCRVLRATGGMIAPDKFKWFLVDFKWTGSDYVYRNMEEMPGEITLLDRNAARIPLQRLDVSQAEESLDVWITMDGSQDKHIEIMKKKAQVFAARISTKKVLRNDALYTYNSWFMKTLEYPMAAT